MASVTNNQSQNQNVWRASAPSNIALIKYMGKSDSSSNVPTNASLSYTLPHLRSYVELRLRDMDDKSGRSEDMWEPLLEFEDQKIKAITLSDKGKKRFLNHLQKMKHQFGVTATFVVRSGNDFPSDCGLASSASSFAALTLAALEAFCTLTDRRAPSLVEASNISRLGSGSSCRSFFAPWSIWDADGARAVSDIGFEGLIHQVVVVDRDVKAVSSSEAHLRVATSELFDQRPKRAEKRVKLLTDALANKNWIEAYELSWAEFWDMHALFETSQPSFGYMTPASLEVLRFVQTETWRRVNDGPIITMDAGPNVHLLYRPDPAGCEMAKQIETNLALKFQVISNSKTLAGPPK